MKILNIICILLSLHWCVAANNSYPFYNEKEGVSIYLDNKGKKAVNRFKSFLADNNIAIKEIDQLLTNHLKFVPAPSQPICEIELVSNLAKDAGLIYPSLPTAYLRELLLYSRGHNLVDDVAMYPLIFASEIINNKTVYKEGEYPKVYTANVLIEASDIIKKELKKQNPVLVNWKIVYGKLITKFVGSSRNFFTLQDLLFTLYHTKNINEATYNLTKKLAASDAHLISYYLKSYYKHKQTYQSKHNNFSSLVAKKASKKSAYSYRQSFFQKYSNPKFKDLQIKALASLLDQFSNTLYYSEVEIKVKNTVTGSTDNIKISPIEQYNFAIKQLRKAIIELEQRYYFYKDSKQIEYMDVILAAFEVGTLSADVLEEVAAIETSWKPEQKKGEKAKKWLSRIGNVGSTFLPPPFNLITSTGLIIIESLSNNKTEDHEKVHNLF